MNALDAFETAIYSDECDINNSNNCNYYPLFGQVRANCEVCFIYTSLLSWEKAAAVNRLNQKIAGVVMLPDIPPNQHIWHVSKLHCLIIESGTPSKNFIDDLVLALYRSGAVSVNSMPDVDYTLELATFNTVEQTWQIQRPYLRTEVSLFFSSKNISKC